MRKLLSNELTFIAQMLTSIPDGGRIISSLPDRFVEEMDDGRMGGLKFVSSKEDRSLGVVLAEKEFVDQDGVPVIATLNLDSDGELYELDVWKVDFSPLKSFPFTE